MIKSAFLLRIRTEIQNLIEHEFRSGKEIATKRERTKEGKMRLGIKTKEMQESLTMQHEEMNQKMLAKEARF